MPDIKPFTRVELVELVPGKGFDEVVTPFREHELDIRIGTKLGIMKNYEDTILRTLNVTFDVIHRELKGLFRRKAGTFGGCS